MESDQAKLFVGGISRETNEEILKQHFEKYGGVLWSHVAKDRNSGIPRGFGFVLFSEVSAATDALREKHVILGRNVEVKKAILKSEQQVNHRQNRFGVNDGYSNHCGFSTRKIFVGGLPASLTEDEFKGYFERFGRITDVVVMHDGVTHRPRGFGFITFDREESVENVMKANYYDLNGRFVEVKRAVPKDVNKRYGAGVSSYDSVPVTYSLYSPGPGLFPSYVPAPVYGAGGGYYCGTPSFYGLGYPPMGGYVSYYYEFPMPYTSPWNHPYSDGAFLYPGCTNTSVRITGNANSAHYMGSGLSEKVDQVADAIADADANGLLPGDGVQPQAEGEMLNDDSSEFQGSNDAAFRKFEISNGHA